MERWYDEEEDILGLHFQDKEYWKSIELSNGIVIDISEEGEIIGMEVHKASDVFSGDVKKVIDMAKEMVKG
ncbi:hypothetical protein CMI42_00535 [Candidatus Pacearchaeota archaeon]|nr:hypothetical protein [Candidatus Pacearchaeota archaeon]|tara:strand:- start:2485 stop:2697 length:213 start_codon:yes stop_codon:yes gene_type:complete